MDVKKKTLEQQVLYYQIIGITLAIILSLGISLYVMIHNEMAGLDRNISNIGAMLSKSPAVLEILKKHEPSDTYNEYLDEILGTLDYVDIVSICDTDSIRLYHTDKDKIGQRFSGSDEAPILQGAAPYMTYATGTLGRQRRVFYPVLDEQQTIIGFIMVSVLTTNITQVIVRILLLFTAVSILLLFLGWVFAYTFNRRLYTTLLGYKPEEFTKLYIEREEVLDALEEGIFAIDTDGCLILMNKSARKMLDLSQKPKIGSKLIEVFPETRLLHTLETQKAEYNLDFVIHGLNILSSRIPIMENGKLTGAVSIFRDKTEFTRLAEELTGARYTVDTLRAFNHEFQNKLHVILGYLEMGEYPKVTELILNSTMASTKAVEDVTRLIQMPSLAALIIGKMIRANELGIQMQLKPDSFCNEAHTNLPLDIYITILGNLIDNAIEELNKHANRFKEINVGVYIWHSGTILSVDDTAGGIPEDLQTKIFEQGFSTKGAGRGTGLYLIKDIADRYHGTIELESTVGVGTSFTITIAE